VSLDRDYLLRLESGLSEVPTSLERFKRAHADSIAGFESALAELRAGRKRGHWIWYVFPQLAGLGSSSQSRTYGIDGLAEAILYLRDPVLSSRLLAASTAVAEQVRNGISLETLMGSSIDVLKLVSSLTLFEAAAGRLCGSEGGEAHASLGTIADEILSAAFAEGYPRCQYTLARLRA
jgi:uncharacterized protein (DUF1810 family)